jgi:hypothetical protein
MGYVLCALLAFIGGLVVGIFLVAQGVILLKKSG